MADYLHNHPQFADLLRIVAEAQDIDAALVEKDYWIMHGLHGLQQLGLTFELKGGTSLSKGLGIIHRFSEDIDIRLSYPTLGGPIDGLKDGILLEVGFANVQPNAPHTISSWAYDHAVSAGVEVIDNRARDVACYHPGYTLVEKLQAISTKFRKQQAGGEFPPNFMRHYYDVYCLLQNAEVQAFVGTDAYFAHKADHFPGADKEMTIAENDAFRLSDPDTRATLAEAYARSSALYYRGQPPFEELLAEIGQWADRL